MDENLQQLKRAAFEGDKSAALQYFQALARLDQAIKPPVKMSEESQLLHVLRPRMAGTISVYPSSLTEVHIRNHSFTDEEGRRHINPIMVFNVSHNIVARYYFYPDLGWMPYSPETVAHAQKHQERFLRSRPEVVADRRWTSYLPRVGYDYCFACRDRREPTSPPGEGEESSRYGLNLTRRNRNVDEPGSIKAMTAIDNYLREAIPIWAQEHQAIMRQAHLNYLQNQKKNLMEKVNKLFEELDEVRSKLADAVIEEIQLE